MTAKTPAITHSADPDPFLAIPVPDADLWVARLCRSAKRTTEDTAPAKEVLRLLPGCAFAGAGTRYPVTRCGHSVSACCSPKLSKAARKAKELRSAIWV